MPLPRGLTFTTLAVMVILVAAVAALPNTAGKELEIRAPGGLDLDQAWDGTTELAERSDRATYFGIAGALYTSVVIGTCTLAGINPGLVPVCSVAIVGALLGTFLASLAGIASSGAKRSIDDADGYYLFNYPTLGGGPSMFHQMQNSFHAGDGLPVHIGDTSCENNQTCHSLWYSKIEKQDSLGKDRVFHHIHATPQYYDFRANLTDGTTGNRRRNDVHESDSSVTSDSGTNIYGGYVFETRDTATDQEMLDIPVKQFKQNVADQMSKEYEDNKRFERYGIYCMDFATQNDPSVGTVGYTWYYADHNSYPSDDEENLMNTCAEEAKT